MKHNVLWEELKKDGWEETDQGTLLHYHTDKDSIKWTLNYREGITTTLNNSVGAIHAINERGANLIFPVYNISDVVEVISNLKHPSDFKSGFYKH